jgi:hypothetical protein
MLGPAAAPPPRHCFRNTAGAYHRQISKYLPLSAPVNTSTLAVLKRRYFNSFIIRKILISIRAIKYEIFIEKEGAKS